MKTGVMGGTFDPIHLGHITMAEAAFEEYGLDRLWFMPAGDPYFKYGSRVTEPLLRLEMTRACVSGLRAGYECSDFEIRDKGRTYSAETFKKLRELYPQDEFYFIVGMDSLKSLEKWYRPELLLENAVLLCAARNGEPGPGIEELAERIRLKFKASDPDIRIIHAPVIDISSTMIREMVREGRDISPYVTKETADFIYEHGLYSDRCTARQEDSEK